MPWSYSATAFHGNKATPAKGNYVTVQVINEDLPEDQRYRYLTYTFDGKKTRAQFITMVKAEAKATIADWNTTLPEVDATADFQVTILTAATTLSLEGEGEGKGETPEPEAAPAPAARKTTRATSRSKA
jgi:hypothetical protein